MIPSGLRLRFLKFVKEVFNRNLVKLLHNVLLVMDVKKDEEIFWFRK
jgi:hypothetical protein